MTDPGFGEIAEKLRRSTVQVSTGHRGHGSGIVVKPEGVIVTNAHVAASDSLHVQFWDGARAAARLMLRDPVRDLAVLHVEGGGSSGWTPATLADSDQLRVGELVIAIGNPFGFIGALTTGAVHGFGRVRHLGPMKWIQADVRLAPGNSGGPLANARGEVVGINTMIIHGLGLAVPSNTVSRILDAGRSQSLLGIVIRPVEIRFGGDPRLGLMILEVAKESAAAAASLMLGDVLVGVDGHPLDSIEDFQEAVEGRPSVTTRMQQSAAQRIIRLQFLRGDHSKVRTVAVLLTRARAVAA